MPQETAAITPPHALEMQEFLFANTLARVAVRTASPTVPSSAWHLEKEQLRVDEITRQIRETLRLQRWFVFTWLAVNGVQIPVELLADQMHPPVGEQLPDQPCA